jgi:hypothetical protein
MLPQDVMHMLFEGLFHLRVKLFLGYIFDDIKVMTISEFNQCWKEFSFAYFEDKPHFITSASLSKGTFGQTAREMWQLYHIFPFIIGDYVPKEDEHLACFLKLQEISCTLH